jgi:hypothetical protein
MYHQLQHISVVSLCDTFRHLQCHLHGYVLFMLQTKLYSRLLSMVVIMLWIITAHNSTLKYCYVSNSSYTVAFSHDQGMLPVTLVLRNCHSSCIPLLAELCTEYCSFVSIMFIENSAGSLTLVFSLWSVSVVSPSKETPNCLLYKS